MSPMPSKSAALGSKPPQPIRRTTIPSVRPPTAAVIIEDRNEYTSENVFWVPTEARWQFLQDRAKQPEIGVLMDHAISPHEGRESSRTFGTRIISGLFVRQKSEACGPR